MDLLKRVNKIPAGTMLVPLFTAAVLNTFCPSILRIGSYSQSLISNDGINVMMFLTLLFTGTQIKIKDIPEALKRGGSHVFFKYLAGALAYFIILKFFGYNGIFGTCTLAILCALTNNNSSLYMGLVQNYGDHADLAARPIFNFNSGPMLTLLTIGVSGGNAVSWEEYVTVLIPLLIGIILSAIDEKIKTATKNGITLILPVMGFILGSGIDLSKIIVSGFGGVFLFILVLIITGPVALFVDRILLKRPGYGGMATVSVAGNTIAVPAMIGQFVPAFRDYVNLATVQISCAVVLSSIICPLIVHWFAKHFGCPKYKEVFQKIEIS
ncbi:2-keto-3-deoxygluconate permease 2 [Clostridium pasteurianum DSM 525 = ATCC 6013]|uniref:2-keto-3-deoxygluconate permease n=1 Tax=Clostridium pasteurianum DSM 525 = ATCC 6013 TaxID=1262449 RepID=A0A0H3J1B3_CLOPA|nr:2-keto-3-deoxygluconate permease [Clostridium pasteurianum]AJA46507.1 2-keto-3-deoxygluconate permease 2 [Clostridium pasteurianum DSM 525 = ATCC 6013]AJA50495.1 2-keto-3-deoxygluconate permease 2 [Clostridium pasteurianum DSM 525 = ATCC 6013]AOZ73933.1 2-keto-3-deoxygluconate permease [Clostridium pasteurianum DSM 525 = ATCC 6013]AOZ77730.1 2-keto-3-deoxygluconate permease [Clostridium pasteurianum]ELP61080.1 2-keto-3-deoxygluconate permease [Clostridium pasteurianum DSM 525 = ATCC 6013]